MAGNMMVKIDIFCRVVDNFGDIGTCWRLSKNLAELGHQVRLWVDDLYSFSKIESQVQPSRPTQTVRTGATSLDVLAWEDEFPSDLVPAELVIEAFGCDLPDVYQRQMPGATDCWINLEYLAVEPWADECHLLPSPQANNVPKFFFFPGFTTRTGGLIREEGLTERFAKLRSDPDSRRSLLERYAGPLPLSSSEQDPFILFIFCYPDAPLEALLKGLHRARRDALVLWAGSSPYERCTGVPGHLDGRPWLRHVKLPFVDQPAFDALLSMADFNVVRGEDSLGRAIWAGKPFLWQLYPQQAHVHMLKLDAWLQSAQIHGHYAELFRAFNAPDPEAVCEGAAHLFGSGLDDAARQAQLLHERLLSRKNLSLQLLEFFHASRQNR